MTQKRFITLMLTSLLLIILATVSINFNSQTYYFDNRGKTFLTNFTKNINDISLISIESFDNTIDLIKEENSYISKSGYPLKNGLWENLITSLSLLRIEEKKTNNPNRHAELNLLLPELNKSDLESEGYATKLTLTKKDGSIYSSILFGKTDPSVGGLSGGQFARMPNNNQSYLLKGAIRMPTSRSDWFESLLFTVKNKDFLSASLTNKTQIFKVESIEELLKLSYPKNLTFKVDKSKLSDIRETINGFYFYDVRKSKINVSNNLPTLTFETKNGLILSLSSVTQDTEEESWITIKANAKKPGAKKLADEITSKTIGYEFLANINTSDILRWNIQNLASKDK